MNGLLLVDKPIGLSSFRVVSKIRGIIKSETGQKLKVGHSGTLDPMASGLLLLAIGGYTKRLPELIKKDKTYLVEMTLGQVSTTGDSEGEITSQSSTKPALPELKKVLKSFEGDILQTPPIYSAIKINGQRAYDLARKGQIPKMEPRKVSINSINLTSYNYPKVEFEADVSSGTYIRSLVEDIGRELGTGAYMSNLRRTRIGLYDINNATKLENLNFQSITSKLLS